MTEATTNERRCQCRGPDGYNEISLITGLVSDTEHMILRNRCVRCGGENLVAQGLKHDPAIIECDGCGAVIETGMLDTPRIIKIKALLRKLIAK
jgi:hypothetical protein